MADIRIKDLTTTASSSASDDFIAVDGTTNGTRKLNAFSPTFGGNATVTGTLTVNGTGTNSIPNLSVTGIGGLNVSANFLTSANTLRFSDSAAGGQTWFMSPQLGDGVATNFAFYSNDGVTSTPLFRVSSAGVFRLPSTAASTTTSTGALVVSGGVGVGGAIVAGGTITSTASTDSGLLQLNLVNSSTGTSASSLFRFNAGTRTATLQAYNDTHATLAGQLRVGTSNGDIVLVPSGVASATFGASSTTFGSTVNVSVGNGTAATLGLNQTGVANAYLTQKATSGDLALGNGGGDQLTIAKTTGVVSITSSSISTTTSSGALVVSGGVGVGGKVTSTALGLANTSQSATAWGDVGVQLSVAGAVLTDTSSSGTVGRIVTNSIAASALAASSTTTYTAAASLFIAGAPTANTNVTITNAYALYTAGGRINFQGLPTSSAGLQAGTLWNDGGTLKVA